MADLFVTNFNKNQTGVSTTTANVVTEQAKIHDMRLVGRPLLGCPTPISLREARQLTRAFTPTAERPFAIWHVRRNTEMRAAIWARDVLGLPLKTVFTSAKRKRHSAVPRLLISKMDAVIATSPPSAELIGKNLVATVPHGVNCDLFTPSQERRADWARLGYGGEMGIATVGRIRPDKGTDIFVHTMLELLPQMPGVTALVLGKAKPEHQGFYHNLIRQIRAAGLQDRILFPGEIKLEDLPRVMRSLTMVLQLARYEGFGVVPQEAMASGVPFVGSDTGYYRKLSAGGKTGRLVRIEDISGAAAAAKEVLSNPEMHAQMAQAARQEAMASFSIQREAAGIEAVYQDLWAKG